MKRRILRQSLASVLLLFAFIAKAVIIQALDLDKLTADATLIVAGQVISVQELAKTTVQVGDRRLSAREMIAELRADHVLKGNARSSSRLSFHFVIPDEFIGWRSVTPSGYRVFFLVESSGEFSIANPYHPSIPAVPNTDTGEGAPIERVVIQLAAVLESSNSSSEDKREAVFDLSKTQTAAAVHALRRVAEVKDLNLRLSVSAALLEHGDISTLQFAEDNLVKPDPTTPADLLHNLSYAILIGVKDESAVPELVRLLRAGSAETRRAAASALMHSGASSAVDPLLSAIDDSDPMVQYYAVVGLAEITGQTDWRPNTFDFSSDSKKYLDHWREFAKSR